MSRPGNIPTFNREFFESSENFTTIGEGNIGGKAQGLAFIKNLIEVELGHDQSDDFILDIPRLTVIATDVFDMFIERNNLVDLRTSKLQDYQIAHEFLQGQFPVEFVGDLMALISSIHTPLAIRSSSLLEDSLQHPFAGVYNTKMIPNNQPDTTTRFHKLVEAIKLVWASTYFAEAQAYIRNTTADPAEEKMAVIIQEVVGFRHGDRFYPNISGVARSYNYYRFGDNKPEEGIVNLALGLGKTIVDGGICWSYCPAAPQTSTPFGTIKDLLQNTQLKFWSVNMGKPPEYDPIKEAEYLREDDLSDSEGDQTLALVASTYDAASDRIQPGIQMKGPRILNFAPVLTYESIPLNDWVKKLIHKSREHIGVDVEMEFAITVDPISRRVRLGFLQIRPMLYTDEKINLPQLDDVSAKHLVVSNNVLGNGRIKNVRHIMYVKKDSFDKSKTLHIAKDIADLNEILRNRIIPYILIGFGRWGSNDRWLGIPVVWSQISGAQAIVECTLPEMNIELSQGSHFFHNLTSFQVPYFSVRHHKNDDFVNWELLDQQTSILETDNMRLIQLDHPVSVLVDGRSGKGIIIYE